MFSLLIFAIHYFWFGVFLFSVIFGIFLKLEVEIKIVAGNITRILHIL